jgi:hypothetical protein
MCADGLRSAQDVGDQLDLVEGVATCGVTVLVQCYQTVVAVLLQCCYGDQLDLVEEAVPCVVTVLLQGCYSVGTVLVQCWYSVGTVLVQCWYSVVTVFLQYCEQFCYTVGDQLDLVEVVTPCIVTVLKQCYYSIVTLLVIAHR